MVEELKRLRDTPEPPPVHAIVQPLALDVSMERTRALHRVWRALNDGDCPKCHTFHSATEINRSNWLIECPSCGFIVTRSEIEDIEMMFAPAMDAAVAIFEEWRASRVG